jgi:hypothetical protein
MGRDRLTLALNGYLGLVKEFGQPFVLACLKKRISRAPLRVILHRPSWCWLALSHGTASHRLAWPSKMTLDTVLCLFYTMLQTKPSPRHMVEMGVVTCMCL